MTSKAASPLLSFCDHLSSFSETTNVPAIWANRVLVIGVVLFAISLPHSIAAIWISLSLCLVGWMVRDLAARKFYFVRTPLDWPLLGFAGLTIISSLASAEPAISLPKTRSLFIFAVLYLCVTNLRARAVNILLGLLLASGLAGVLFSFGEKIIGRGMIVTSIAHDSPLATSQLQTGDVIWMIGRKRVSSLEEANQILRQQPTDKLIEIEALHAGDPLPVELRITDALKAQTNPLGINVDGRSRRFRISGFTRHFLTYAEQMQIFGLLLFGLLVARGTGVTEPQSHEATKQASLLAGPPSLPLPFSLSLFLFALFSLALILTASRAVIAAFLLALVLTSLLVASRRIALITLAAALTFGSIAGYVLISTRTSSAINFADDSSSRRIGYMKAGLKLIPQHPLLGVGMDAHKKHWSEWGFPGDYITHTHSTPIQLAMERGLPAFGCFVWLLAAMGLWLWRSYKQQKNPLALGALAALLGFALSSLTNYNFGDSEVVMLLLFLVGLSVLAEARP
ncbi:MAG: O-antigen ligase family protein [Acidobacteria bacterium]|nr:O-antigen ligase family protein [Acidobacteriota bacterium]